MKIKRWQKAEKKHNTTTSHPMQQQNKINVGFLFCTHFTSGDLWITKTEMTVIWSFFRRLLTTSAVEKGHPAPSGA